MYYPLGSEQAQKEAINTLPVGPSGPTVVWLRSHQIWMLNHFEASSFAPRCNSTLQWSFSNRFLNFLFGSIIVLRFCLNTGWRSSYESITFPHIHNRFIQIQNVYVNSLVVLLT